MNKLAISRLAVVGLLALVTLGANTGCDSGNQAGDAAKAPEPSGTPEATQPTEDTASSDHPGTTPGEMAYKGAPVPEHLASKDVITPGAPPLTEAEFAKATQIYF